MGVFQARILQWDLFDPGIESVSSGSPILKGGFFTAEPPGMEPINYLNCLWMHRQICYSVKKLLLALGEEVWQECVRAGSVALGPTLFDLKDCGLPGSSVLGILQARVLEWVAIFLSMAGILRQNSKIQIFSSRFGKLWRPFVAPLCDWRRKWQPTPIFVPGESHGRRSLVGYSPWGCKESDTTEWLHFHFHFMWLLTFLSHFYSMFSSFNVFLFSEGNITFYAGNITFFIFLCFQDLHLAAIATKYIKKVRLIMKLRSRCLLKLLNC